MKGIVLAGGTGSRLYPLTKVTNKHLLPIGSFPMIHYPITSMTNAGINDIMIISGTEHVGDMIGLLGSGKEYNCDFTFKVQDQPDGIAGALKLCKNFVGQDKCLVLLGDNIFERDLLDDVETFNSGAKFFFKEVKDPQRYGVGVFNKDSNLVKIEEKPKKPKSNLGAMGIYMYDYTVFDSLDKIKKSRRGEYEITSVNNYMIKNYDCDYVVMESTCVDAGTMESYHSTNKLVYENE
jgi:glucose-1-phosphate thymidylyltransferase